MTPKSKSIAVETVGIIIYVTHPGESEISRSYAYPSKYSELMSVLEALDTLQERRLHRQKLLHGLLSLRHCLSEACFDSDHELF